MTSRKSRSLSEYLRSLGVEWDEIEAAHSAKRGRARFDSYDNAQHPQQCQGFVAMAKRGQGDTGSDRCRQRTKHPSGYCHQHRKVAR